MAVINENGNTEFKRQPIYRHKTSFKQAMRYLIGINAVEKIQSREYPFNCVYHLTPNGEIFINGLKK